MDVFLDALSALHVLRPWWLLGVPAVSVIWWLAKRGARSHDAPFDGIAPHLAQALTVGETGQSRWQPLDSAALAVILLLVAASGPTWSRVPNPFLSQTSPMMVVLEVSRSMEAPDLPPGRLERGKFKIMDLVQERAGARTGLIAYASSAHRVAPLTEDPEILRAMLEGLTPDVMPSDGNNTPAALEMAQRELAKTETPGTILLVTDGVDSTDMPALAADEQNAPVIALFAAPESEPFGLLEGYAGTTVRLTADDRDLDQIQRAAATAYRAALLGDERLDWEDRGWMFGWPAALLILFWFRQGWTIRWIWVACALTLGGLPAGQAQADIADWFFTPDQQGMMVYRNKDYATAVEKFQDPMWRGYMLMKTGGFAEAAELYARIDTAEAAFAQGYAHIRNREYRPAIAAYERALSLQPDFPAAERNLEIAKVVLEYVETTREANDTGEDRGIGADDVVFDNKAQRGSDTETDFSDQTDKPDFATTEQWMRSVDTNMGDFLKSRFRLEAATGDSQ